MLVISLLLSLVAAHLVEAAGAHESLLESLFSDLAQRRLVTSQVTMASPSHQLQPGFSSPMAAVCRMAPTRKL